MIKKVFLVVCHMKKQQKINISYSCSEDENKMATLDDRIKFCYQCEKNVIDFRNEIDLVIYRPVCGIFSSSQINKIQRKSVISNFSKPISIATLLGVSLLPLNTFGQEKSIETTKLIEQEKDSSIFKIRGTLIDEANNEELPFVNLHLLYSGNEIHSTVSDFSGNFLLSIDTNKYPLHNLELAINFVGYQGDTVDIPISGNLIIELESGVDLEYIQITRGYAVPSSFSNDTADFEKVICEGEKKKIFRKRKKK